MRVPGVIKAAVNCLKHRLAEREGIVMGEEVHSRQL